MSKKSKIGLWIGIISLIVTLVATITTLVAVREKKKKEDEELVEYLDCSIQ